MQMISTTFDVDAVEWRRVTEPGNTDVHVDFEYSLLAYDLDCGRLDMLLRLAPGGHCRRHRHLASTVTLVLDGEQHLTEMLPDGTTKSIVRKKGDYAMAPADALAHDECGGDAGGLVLLSMQATDGMLFEYFDENMENPRTLSIQQYVDSWNQGTVHGAPPRTDAAA